MITITGSLINKMYTISEAAANGALIWTGIFGLMFIYLFISDYL